MKKEKQVKQKIIPTYRLFSKTGMFQDYPACSFCGQNEIPFKKGVCPRCCSQVGDIRYVKDPKEYVKSNYGDVKIGIAKAHQELDKL